MSATATAVLRKVAAGCLCYPDDLLYSQLPTMRAALTEMNYEGPLLGFLDHVEATGELDLATHYVATFDTRNRRCLYLTWWTTGDTRNRGQALIDVKEHYRAHGVEGEFGGELPDFLPVVLEFAAIRERAGTELLERHRAGLELLRLAIEQCGSPYAVVLQAVCATLPGPSPRTREEAKALARGGPPQELVGIDLAPAPIPASTLWQKVRAR